MTFWASYFLLATILLSVSVALSFVLRRTVGAVVEHESHRKSLEPISGSPGIRID